MCGLSARIRLKIRHASSGLDEIARLRQTNNELRDLVNFYANALNELLLNTRRSSRDARDLHVVPWTHSGDAKKSPFWHR